MIIRTVTTKISVILSHAAVNAQHIQTLTFIFCFLKNKNKIYKSSIFMKMIKNMVFFKLRASLPSSPFPQKSIPGLELC